MADQYWNMSTYSARILAHTPSNTSTFLRGDNTFTNILTTGITIQAPNNSSQEFLAIRGAQGIWMGIGTNNSEHGLYSTGLNRWIVYVDPNRNIVDANDTSQVRLLGNADTANSLYSTPGTSTQFLRSDNTWSNTLEGPFNSTGMSILTFEYIGYDTGTHAFVGRPNQRGALTIDDYGVTLLVPNGPGDGLAKSLLTFFVKNNYDSKPAPIDALQLITYAASEFTGILSSTATDYSTVNSGLVLREVNRISDDNLHIKYAPRLGFNWDNQTSGSLCMDNEGLFYLIKADGTSIADMKVNADFAYRARSDEDGINEIKYQYVRVFNSNKLKSTVNGDPAFNTTLTVDQLAAAGNAFGTIASTTHSPSAGTINCLSISRHMPTGTGYTSQIAIDPTNKTIYFRGVANGAISSETSWRQMPTFTQNTAVGSYQWPVYVQSNGILTTISEFGGNSYSASYLDSTWKIWGQDFDGHRHVNGQITINNNDIIIQDSATTTRQIRWQVGGSDYARVGAGATQSDAGWIELATSGDGDEPIYIRQYTGTFTTIKRSTTLMDASGNSDFEGKITATNHNVSGHVANYYGFIGNLDGRARYTDRMSNTSNTPTEEGGTEQPVYFTDGKPKSTTYYLKANVDGANNYNTHLAYYSENRKITASVITSDGSYLADITTVSIGTGHTNSQSALVVNGAATVSTTIWCGTQTTNTAGSGTRQIGVANGAGKLYIYSEPATTGNRGLSGNNAGGTTKAYITIDSNNNASFFGNATTATTADKLGTNNAGTNQKPVYFSGGVPVQCNGTLAVDISGTAASANSVAWANISGRPAATGSGDRIAWGDLDLTNIDYFAASYRKSGSALALALEDYASSCNTQEINFDTRTYGVPSAISFNNHLKRQTNASSDASNTTSNTSSAVEYFFCCYKGANLGNANGRNTAIGNAYLYAGRVYNAYWNDYAEFRRTINAKPGQVVIDKDDGSMEITSKRLMPGAQIISNTYGHAMGESDKDKTPVAVAGRVLACPYRDKSEYHAGMAVCSAPNGTVDIMSKLEIVLHPDCIIGFVSEIPDYDTWGQVKVDGRIWIKLR